MSKLYAFLYYFVSRGYIVKGEVSLLNYNYKHFITSLIDYLDYSWYMNAFRNYHFFLVSLFDVYGARRSVDDLGAMLQVGRSRVRVLM
jgi:hypothetical protein